MEDEDIDMETVHDSQAFIHHHLNLLERPSTPGKQGEVTTAMLMENTTSSLKLCPSSQARSRRRSSRPCCPCPPHRFPLLPRSPHPPCHPNTAVVAEGASTAATITTTTSTRRRRRSTSTNTNTSTSTRAKTRTRTGTATTRTPSATVQPAAGPCPTRTPLPQTPPESVSHSADTGRRGTKSEMSFYHVRYCNWLRLISGGVSFILLRTRQLMN